MGTASIVLFSSHDVSALRTTLHGIWDTATQPYELVVLASRCDEEIAAYLMRQYRRGRISSFGFDTSSREPHCGLDHGFHFVSGEYLVRAHDDLEFQAGWLDKVMSVMEDAPQIGLLGLVNNGGKRKRGRPPKLRIEPQPAEHLDTSCFVTYHHLFERHESELMGERDATSCLYQARLLELDFELAYLPGLVRRVPIADEPVAPLGGGIEGDRPFHEAASGTVPKITQVYELGEDVLLTCMTCGTNELEVLAVTVDFCAAHGVPVGYTYTLRCGSCQELQYEEDRQYRCPEDERP